MGGSLLEDETGGRPQWRPGYELQADDYIGWTFRECVLRVTDSLTSLVTHG